MTIRAAVLALGCLVLLVTLPTAQSELSLQNESRITRVEERQAAMEFRLGNIETMNRGILIVVIGQLVVEVMEARRVRRRREE